MIDNEGFITEIPISFHNQSSGSINFKAQRELNFPFQAKFFDGSSVSVNSGNIRPILNFSNGGAWFQSAYPINGIDIKIGNANKVGQGGLSGNVGASLSFNKNMTFGTGSVQIPITIASGGVLNAVGNGLSLNAKITNQGTIETFDGTTITFGTNAAIENHPNAVIMNPNFSTSQTNSLILDNYGTITYSIPVAYNVRSAKLNNYNTIKFTESCALFLYQNAIFGASTDIRFNTAANFITTGVSPALFIAAPLKLDADFNAESAVVNLYTSAAALSGNGKLTIKKTLLWGYGSISCPVEIKLGASAELFYNGSNLSLNNIFDNNGTTTLYQPKVNFNNGTFNNNKKLVVAYGVSDFLNTSGTNTFNNCGMLTSANVTTFNIYVGFPSCAMGTIGGSITYTSNELVVMTGTLSPAMSPGTMTINPSVKATSTAIFDMEIIGGYGAAGIADDADKLVSTGNIEINGTLILRLTNPAVGNYTIIDGTSLTGSFVSIQYFINGSNIPAPQPGNLSISYSPSEGTVTVNISAVLPVELLTFQAQNTEGGNLLTWQTSTEVNTSHFDIEQSSDGKIFQKIGETKAQGKAATYSYLDKAPFGGWEIMYYRLKINDLDNKSSYSNIVSISKNSTFKIKIYPNPTHNNMTIDLGETSQATIRLIDILGREIIQKQNQSGQVLLDMSSRSVGIYFAEITAKGISIREKVIKN